MPLFNGRLTLLSIVYKIKIPVLSAAAGILNVSISFCLLRTIYESVEFTFFTSLKKYDIFLSRYKEKIKIKLNNKNSF